MGVCVGVAASVGVTDEITVGTGDGVAVDVGVDVADGPGVGVAVGEGTGVDVGEPEVGTTSNLCSLEPADIFIVLPDIVHFV